MTGPGDALRLPEGHDERVRRARLSLRGLSTGDAFGQQFFYRDVAALLASRTPPPGTWRYTDDTVMAMSITDILAQYGTVDRDALAAAFAGRFGEEPSRGYGPTAIDILEAIVSGVPWRAAAGRVFGGGGSMGNGGAMRVSPVGAYFADDLDEVARNAAASAEVTHAHPEGQAGAVAVAVAAAQAWRARGKDEGGRGEAVMDAAIGQTPEGATREGLRKAAALPPGSTVAQAVAVLGNGLRLIASDTVPFALWCASRHLYDYEEALWTTASGGGDIDTTCAMVGGIVSLSAGGAGIPEQWSRAREPLGPGRTW